MTEAEPTNSSSLSIRQQLLEIVGQNLYTERLFPTGRESDLRKLETALMSGDRPTLLEIAQRGTSPFCNTLEAYAKSINAQVAETSRS